MPPRSGPERVSKSFTIRKDLADAIDSESESRVIAPSLLVERLVEVGLSSLPPVNLPTGPIPAAPSGTGSIPADDLTGPNRAASSKDAPVSEASF